jgi:ferrous iron transport protein B
MSTPSPTLTAALAGQPNVGKSTIFNALTHQAQYVSNWPGKTCEICTGFLQLNGEVVQLVDLPGTYSLTTNSEEERIARDYIIQARPDVVIAVVDAVSLERNLYLVAELLGLPVPVIIALNRMDTAAQQGMLIEPHVLQAALGVPVVPVVGTRGQGLQTLLAQAVGAARSPGDWAPNRPEIQADHRDVMDAIEAIIAGHTPDPYPLTWVALKLLEGDAEITKMMQASMGADWEKVHAVLVQHDDAFLAVASGRYEWIGRMVRAAVVRPKTGPITFTDRLDRFATHPFYGMLTLLSLMGAIFFLTFFAGAPLQAWLELVVVEGAAAWTRSALQSGPAWVSGMLAGGVITGVGTVLTLLPILFIFFASLGLLEDVGYMARAAYVMDRFMHWMGLHGKSFLPMFLGFGCNVPALMGARIIESPRARLTTLLVTPLVPCTARMSVVALLAPVFFGIMAFPVTLGLVALTLVVLAALGILLHRVLLGSEQTAFIMELPLYHPPDLKAIGQGVWQRLQDFLKGAGTVILVVSVILWALSTYPGGSIETSYLAYVGQWLAPVGDLMGLEWQMMVALLTSVVRKENTIPTLAVLYSAHGEGGGLLHVLGGRLSPASALAFLSVQILFIPCMAVVATLRQETRSWSWTALSVFMLLGISLGVGIFIYQFAAYVGWGV